MSLRLHRFSPPLSLTASKSYGELQSNYAIPYYGPEQSQMGYFPASGPQQIMSVTNLLDQNLPENLLSEEKSNELFETLRSC